MSWMILTFVGFALYRALLRDTRRTLVDEERSRFAYDVCPKLRYTFRYNARLQSPKDIVEALRQGYAVSRLELPGGPASS